MEFIQGKKRKKKERRKREKEKRKKKKKSPPRKGTVQVAKAIPQGLLQK